LVALVLRKLERILKENWKGQVKLDETADQIPLHDVVRQSQPLAICCNRDPGFSNSKEFDPESTASVGVAPQLPVDNVEVAGSLGWR